MLAQVLRVHPHVQGELTVIGRCCVMTFSVCTEPIAANGKSNPVASDITLGKVSANG